MQMTAISDDSGCEENLLQNACRVGDLDTIKTCILSENNLINMRDSKLNWTPLFRSTVSNCFAAAQFLLENGADPDIPNDHGETPLHQAAEASQCLIIELLLKFNANPNLKDVDGETPLHFAVYNGNSQIVRTLLVYHADPNLANVKSWRTPLHCAARKNNRECIAALLRYGGDQCLRDKSGKRAIDVVKDQGVRELMQKHLRRVSEEAALRGKLHYSLEKIGVEHHYELLVRNGFDNIDEMANQMRTPVPLTSRDLEAIGIAKAGDRYRILLFLHNEGVKGKTAKKGRVYCPRSIERAQASLKEWVQENDLTEILGNLQESGYDTELLVKQALSPFRFNHIMLHKELGIVDRTLRGKLLLSLQRTLTHSFSNQFGYCNTCIIM